MSSGDSLKGYKTVWETRCVSFDPVMIKKDKCHPLHSIAGLVQDENTRASVKNGLKT